MHQEMVNTPPEWYKLKHLPGFPWEGCYFLATGEQRSYHNAFGESYIFICQVESYYTIPANACLDIYCSLRACFHHCTLQTSKRENLTSNLYSVSYTNSHPSSAPLITQKPPKPMRREVPGAYEVTEAK